MASNQRKSLGGPTRVKREKSPVQNTHSSEFKELIDEISPYNSPTNAPKRQRSSIGTASRIKTPIKSVDDNKEISKENNLNNLNRIYEYSHNLSGNEKTLARKSFDNEVDIEPLLEAEKFIKGNVAWSVKDFALSKPIGKGKFGNVYLGKEKVSKIMVALKVLFKAPMQAANCVHTLRREVELHCRIKHPNVVQLHGYFHDAKSVYLILEYVPNGELYKHIAKLGGKVSETVCRDYLKQLSSGICHIHSYGIAHRDIKPENILIDSEGNLKIADFGCAVHIPISTAFATLRYTLCGTPEYVSPEMLTGRGHTVQVDMWAVGVFACECIFGRTPFAESNYSNLVGDSDGTDGQNGKEKIYDRIVSYKDGDILELYGDISKSFSVEILEIITKLLNPNPQIRYTSAILNSCNL